VIAWMHGHQTATVWIAVGVVVAAGMAAAWVSHRQRMRDLRRSRVELAVVLAPFEVRQRRRVACGRARVPMYSPRHAAREGLYRSVVVR
jgi:hypothetical protein